MDWDKLRIFHAAAAAGSFTHAGDTLGMSQSAVSRQVSALEKDLAVSLFHRHARGLQLTEQGDLLFATVAEVMGKLQTAEMLLADTKTKPSGDLRITAPVGFGTIWLTPRMRDFSELYPDINVELILNDEQVDISMREADVALWTREPDQPDLIRRNLMTMTVHGYASNAYVRRFGAPQTLEDLDNHRIVSYAGTPAQHLAATTWLDTAGREGLEPRNAAFKVNSLVAMKYAIKAGIGIGMMPDYLTEGESDFIEILTKIEPPTLPILYVYPEELKNSKKIQLLRDFLITQVNKWKR
ncbi:MAG: LysR family transcriptional regulator [Hyphomicrobiaceae bacterium]